MPNSTVVLLCFSSNEPAHHFAPSDQVTKFVVWFIVAAHQNCPKTSIFVLRLTGHPCCDCETICTRQCPMRSKLRCQNRIILHWFIWIAYDHCSFELARWIQTSTTKKMNASDSTSESVRSDSRRNHIWFTSTNRARWSRRTLTFVF